MPAPQANSLYSALLAGWFLDEASGTRADIFGISNFTDMNGVGQATGIIDFCATFESNSFQYLACPNNARISFAGGTKIAVSAWIKVPGTLDDLGQVLGRFSNFNGTDQFFCGVNQGDSGDGFIKPGGIVCQDGINNILFMSGDAEFDSTGWLHLVWNLDLTQTGNDKIKMYVNGVLQSATALLDVGTVVAFDSSSDPISMGGGSDGMALFIRGNIDHTFIWNRTLTQYEIERLYNNGAALRYPF